METRIVEGKFVKRDGRFYSLEFTTGLELWKKNRDLNDDKKPDKSR